MNLNIGNIGIWGKRHYDYLKRNRPSTVSVMRMNGTLERYLKQVNEHTKETLDALIRQYAKDEGITETLKAHNQLEWVRRMNNIRSRSEETILSEIIYK